MNSNNNVANIISKVILSEDLMKKYEEFQKEYSDKSNDYLLREINRVKGEVSQEIRLQHIKNLEYLAQMEGFVTDEVKQKIAVVKEVLNIEDISSNVNPNPSNQFLTGSSLLLWFLLVSLLFRPGFFRRPFRRRRFY